MNLNNMLFTENHSIGQYFINTTMRVDVINNIILSIKCNVNTHKMSESFKGKVLFSGSYVDCVAFINEKSYIKTIVTFVKKEIK